MNSPFSMNVFRKPPANSDGQFLGPLTLREALAKSRNLVSVRVLQQVGLNDARAWATGQRG